MRYAAFLGEGRIELRARPAPVPSHGELLIRVHACALCGSDREAYERGAAVTPGHEISGVVTAAGAGTSTEPGTRGAVFLVAYCGRCERCRNGSRGACLAKEGMTGFDRDGGFAEQVLVPERCLLPLDGRLSLDQAILLLDVIGTPLHALRRSTAHRALPTAVAVFGAGPVGLGSIVVLKGRGVDKVAVVDPSPYRLALAERLGALPIAGGDLAVEAAHERLGEAPGLVMEASGAPTAQRQAVDLLAPGGTLVFVGHSPAPLELWASRDLIATEKTLTGSEYFDSREFGENQRLIIEGAMDPSPIITHRLPLEEIGKAYEVFRSGETGKVLTYPDGPDAEGS